MARKGKVIWTETARNEFIDTCTYWNKRNASQAYTNRLRKLIQSTLKEIALFPKSGIPSPFEGVRFIVNKRLFVVLPGEWGRHYFIVFLGWQAGY